MKRKFLLPILSVCMVVALVSVGFAAWLITGSDTTDTAGGQFVTKEVSNEFFTVKIEQVKSAVWKATMIGDEQEKDEEGRLKYEIDSDAERVTKSLTYGSPVDVSGLDTDDITPWFKFADDVAEEYLALTFKLTLTPDDANALKNILNKLDDNKIIVTLFQAKDADGNHLDDSATSVFDSLAANDYKTMTQLIPSGTDSYNKESFKVETAGEGVNYINYPKFYVSKNGSEITQDGDYYNKESKVDNSYTKVDYSGVKKDSPETGTKDANMKNGLQITLGKDAFTTYSEGATSAVAYVRLEFSWGDFFKMADAGDPVNPYQFFNSYNSKDSATVKIDEDNSISKGKIYRDEAQRIMTSIHELGEKYFCLALDTE